MQWNKESLEEYLRDKQQRSVAVEEYLLVIEHINQLRPKVLIDIGTYKGASGFILGTCCDSIKQVYSIDNINSQSYTPKDEATPEEHGKCLPKGAIFLKNGYETDLPVICKEIEPKEAFIFLDAGKNTLKVIHQLRMIKELGFVHVTVHDSGRIQKSVRRAILHLEKEGLLELVAEDITSAPTKGVSILKFKL
jgi:hypothetical protein